MHYRHSAGAHRYQSCDMHQIDMSMQSKMRAHASLGWSSVNGQVVLPSLLKVRKMDALALYRRALMWRSVEMPAAVSMTDKLAKQPMWSVRRFVVEKRAKLRVQTVSDPTWLDIHQTELVVYDRSKEFCLSVCLSVSLFLSLSLYVCVCVCVRARVWTRVTQ